MPKNIISAFMVSGTFVCSVAYAAAPVTGTITLPMSGDLANMSAYVIAIGILVGFLVRGYKAMKKIDDTYSMVERELTPSDKSALYKAIEEARTRSEEAKSAAESRSAEALEAYEAMKKHVDALNRNYADVAQSHDTKLTRLDVIGEVMLSIQAHISIMQQEIAHLREEVADVKARLGEARHMPDRRSKKGETE